MSDPCCLPSISLNIQIWPIIQIINFNFMPLQWVEPCLFDPITYFSHWFAMLLSCAPGTECKYSNIPHTYNVNCTSMLKLSTQARLTLPPWNPCNTLDPGNRHVESFGRSFLASAPTLSLITQFYLLWALALPQPPSRGQRPSYFPKPPRSMMMKAHWWWHIQSEGLDWVSWKRFKRQWHAMTQPWLDLEVELGSALIGFTCASKGYEHCSGFRGFVSLIDIPAYYLPPMFVSSLPFYPSSSW